MSSRVRSSLLAGLLGVAFAYACSGEDGKRHARADGGAGGEDGGEAGQPLASGSAGAPVGAGGAMPGVAGQTAELGGAAGSNETPPLGGADPSGDGGAAGAASGTGLYDVTPLGALNGFGATAWWLNDAGDVVGRSPFDATTSHAFLWASDTGIMSDLGRLGTIATNYSEAYSINNDGLVVGLAFDGSNRAFTWNGPGTMTGIASLAAANSVNDNGQVAGHRLNAVYNAFRWDAVNGFIDLGLLGTMGANDSYATAINQAGDVVGDAKIDSGQIHAFLWTEAGGMQDIGTVATKVSSSIAVGLNDQGQIVGFSETDDNHTHAFIWTQADGMKEIGYLGADATVVSHANDVNDAGEVVGYSHVGIANHAFIWTVDAGMRDLNDLLVPGATTEVLTDAPAINASGQIICNTEQFHAVLLTPR